MALKPRYKRRIIWSVVTIVAAAIVALVIIPPMITLDGMRGKIEHAIETQTGITAQITGNVHFSLLGRATIVAHDVVIPNGHIDAVMFSVPLTHIFNLADAQLSNRIIVGGATLEISSLDAPDFAHVVDIYDSNMIHTRYYTLRIYYEMGTNNELLYLLQPPDPLQMEKAMQY